LPYTQKKRAGESIDLKNLRGKREMHYDVRIYKCDRLTQTRGWKKYIKEISMATTHLHHVGLFTAFLKVQG
jgi:hypothetical protein